MSEQTSRRKWRWLRHFAWVLAANVTLALVAVVIFFGSGSGNPLIRRLVIRRVNSMTGGSTEIRSLSIQWLSMRASIKGLVVAVVIFFGRGSGNPLIRRLVIRRVNSMTGGSTEIRSLSIQWLSMRASIKG